MLHSATLALALAPLFVAPGVPGAQSLGSAGTDDAGAQAPNVLLLIADDLSWTDVSPKLATPAIDRLRERGVAYRRAYAMPMCSPTRYTLLFGRYGRRAGIGGVIGSQPGPESAVRTDPSLPNLARFFSERGYRTGAFGKWHLGVTADGAPAETPLRFGFDTWRAGTLGNLSEDEGSKYTNWRRIDDGETEASRQYTTLAVEDALLEWWRATDEPKFAWVAFHAGHSPFHVPPKKALPPGTEIGERRGSVWGENRRKFELMVAALDASIGRILDAVDLEETLVVFVSDNGTPRTVEVTLISNRRQHVTQRGGKGSTTEPGIHVPMFIAGPGIPAGEECRELVHTVDVFSTLAEHIHGSVPEQGAEDGISFASTLTNPEAPGARTWVFAEVYSKTKDDVAVRMGNHKLRILDGESFLYHLGKDPREKRPLDPAATAENQAAMKQLARILEEELPPRR